MKISEILKSKKTDKANQHSYGDYYDELFSQYDKEAPVKILELGVQGGGSLQAWKEYFPNAEVIGIDISDSRWPEYIKDNVTFHKCDLRDFEMRGYEGYFDIIIDDSDHFIGTQMYIVNNYLKLLKKGGTMVIEDVQAPERDSEMIRQILHKDYEFDTIDVRDSGRYDDFLIIIKNESR